MERQPFHHRALGTSQRLPARIAVAAIILLAACSPHQADLPLPAIFGYEQMDPNLRARFDDAIRACERFEEEGRADPVGGASSLMSLGDILMAYGQPTQAILAYRNATVLTPKDPLAWLALAHAQESATCPDQAEATLAVVLDLDPANLHARIGLGRIQTARGRFDTAEQVLLDALDIDPTRADALLELSRIALAQDDLSSAEDYIGRALAVQPAATPLIYSMAVVRRAQGRPTEADRLLDAVPVDNRLHIPVSVDDPVLTRISAARADPRRHELRGLQAHARARYALAAAEFRAAVRLDPGRIEARYNLAVSLLRGGHPDQGLAELAAILASHPDHVPSLLAIGSEELMRGDADRAIEHLSEAVRIDGGSARLHTALGRALAGAARYDEALGSFGIAIELDPTATEPRLQAVTTAVASGRCGLAREAFDALSRLTGFDPATAAIATLVDSCGP